MPARSLILRALLISVAAGHCLVSGAAAAEFTVDSDADEIDDDTGDGACLTIDGFCTLRAAVMQSNANSEDDTITLPAGSYDLEIAPGVPATAATGDLDVTETGFSLSLNGAGARTTVIDAHRLDRIFRVSPLISFSVAGVTLRNGLSQNGGAVYNAGFFDAVDSTFSDNEAGDTGGAIHNFVDSGLVLRHCTLTRNKAGSNGGAIDLETSGLTNALDNFVYLTISDNDAAQKGGGIYAHGGPGVLELRRSEVTGNSAATGGGIHVENSTVVEIYESTLAFNDATNGGAIFVATLDPGQEGTLFVTNSTIARNESLVNGGGIYNAGVTWLYNSTIAFNQADADDDFGEGGGFFNAASAMFNPRNSVIAGNTNSAAHVPDDCKGPGTNTGFGYNKFGTKDGCVVGHAGACAGSDSLLDSLSELGPLQSNGGQTRTHAIQAGSGMIDGVVSPCVCNGAESNDQRDGARPQGQSCDIGAFEYGALPAGLVFRDDFELGNLWAWN